MDSSGAAFRVSLKLLEQCQGSMARHPRGGERAERAAAGSAESRGPSPRSIERYCIDLGDAEEPPTIAEAFMEVTGVTPEKFRWEDA